MTTYTITNPGDEPRTVNENEMLTWLIEAYQDQVWIDRTAREYFMRDAEDQVRAYADNFISPELTEEQINAVITATGAFVLDRCYDADAYYYADGNGEGIGYPFEEWQEEYRDDMAGREPGDDEYQTWEEWSSSLVAVVPNIPGTEGYDPAYREWRNA